MERMAIIMQFMFMLLVAVHVTTACSCLQRPLYAFLNDSESTVIRARVVNAVVVDPKGNRVPKELKNDFSYMRNVALTRYLIRLRKTFKEGPVQIFTRDSVFEMTARRGDNLCGFVLKACRDYLLAGTTNHEGEFSTNICKKITSWKDIFESDLKLLQCYNKSKKSC